MGIEMDFRTNNVKHMSEQAQCRKSLLILKGKSEAVNRRRTDNAMVKRKRTDSIKMNASMDLEAVPLHTYGYSKWNVSTNLKGDLLKT
jgi:hypothetical protein